MDGSLAPLPDLVDLAEHHSAILIVDEAHATGVFGQQGRGVCEQMQVEQHVPVRIGTLSKAVGSIGGFVVGQQRLIDWIFNRGRTQVFSTALPAACHAASLAGLQIIRDEPHRRRDLQHHADQLRAGLAELGWRIDKSASQIMPLIVGESERTIRFSALLSDLGLFVPGIRPPTVPHGTSRLRISLSYAHTQDDRNRLLAALRQLKPMD
jgi:7-keto-8-aminopelargonate synthetase-like enzyme